MRQSYVAQVGFELTIIMLQYTMLKLQLCITTVRKEKRE